jgi:hypothetical protein
LSRLRIGGSKELSEGLKELEIEDIGGVSKRDIGLVGGKVVFW